MRTAVVVLLLGVTSVARAEPVEHDEDPDGVSDIQMIVGPPTAAFVGFGMGHVVEGRWHEKGWIFTAGETAAAGLVIAGGICAECDHPSPWLGAAFFTGLLSIGVLRVWETIDSVNGARRKNERLQQARFEREKRIGLGIAPHHGGAIAGLTLRF